MSVGGRLHKPVPPLRIGAPTESSSWPTADETANMAYCGVIAATGNARPLIKSAGPCALYATIYCFIWVSCATTLAFLGILVSVPERYVNRRERTLFPGELARDIEKKDRDPGMDA